MLLGNKVRPRGQHWYYMDWTDWLIRGGAGGGSWMSLEGGKEMYFAQNDSEAVAGHWDRKAGL